MTTNNTVTEIDVESHGILGKLYRPATNIIHPGIIVVGGSGGGLSWSDEVANRLAGKGYAALALAYFRYGDLPKALVNIPLEYFKTAMNWMHGQEEINTEKLVVVGGSRGGELALILGATFPIVKAVIAYAPSSVVWGACGPTTSIGKAAWTYQGHPLPRMKTGVSPSALCEYLKMGLCWISRRPFRETPLFMTALSNASCVGQASIPVENINAPILLISGDDDQIWPSNLMCDMIMDRLRRYGFRFPCKHMNYEDAGHAISFPDLPLEAYYNSRKTAHPLTGLVYDLGGDPEKTAHAAKAAWDEVVVFLEKYVKY